MSMNELQRIGKVLGINTNVEDSRLCLLIQDKIKEKDKLVKKNEFCYHRVKAQNKRLESQIHNLKNEYAESVGIHEYMMVKNSRDTIKKQLNKVLEENHKRNETVRKFNDKEFKEKLKKIEGVR